MRAFVELRKYALGYAELRQRLDIIEMDMNTQFNGIYTALSEMEREKENKARPVIGYIQP
jgi:hypothetical protein